MNILGIHTEFIVNSTLLIGAVAYLSHFFGKVITDCKPIVDDRKWDAELSGVYYIGMYVFLPLTLLLIIPQSILMNFLDSIGLNSFVAVLLQFILCSYLSVFQVIKSRFFYSVPTGQIKWVEKRIVEYIKKKRNFKLSIILVLLAQIQLYYSSNVRLFILGLIFCLIFYFLRAAIFSYDKNVKLNKFNIYFIDTTIAPLLNYDLVKINDDHIKLKKDGKFMIINKNTILRLECLEKEK